MQYIGLPLRTMVTNPSRQINARWRVEKREVQARMALDGVRRQLCNFPRTGPCSANIQLYHGALQRIFAGQFEPLDFGILGEDMKDTDKR